MAAKSIRLLLPLFFSNRNRNIRNGKWNIINVSSGKHLSYIEQLKKNHGDKRFCVHISQAKKNKSISQTGIPELIKITGYVRAVDSSAVNAELESCSKKKGRRWSLYNTSIPSCINP